MSNAFQEKIPLGKTGLRVSRLGLGAAYGATTAGYEEAFERGVNYFYWGSLRRKDMAVALRNLSKQHREELVVVVQSYSRVAGLIGRSVESALRKLKMSYADILLLGWYNAAPPERIMDAAMELKEKGRVRHIALSSHRRTLFPELLSDERYEIWHVRYNAVHRGAETEVFPALAPLAAPARPGLVTYTTTRWGHLCNPRRTPDGEATPSGTDCYRWALSNPHVNTVLSGPANIEQLRQAVAALERGPMDEDELAWMRRVGDAIYTNDVTTKARDRY